MAFEGLLGSLGPTLVREVTPHLVQVFANLGERFRKDSREIKASFDEEIASLARTHAALLSGAGEQRERVETLTARVAAVEQKVGALQESVDAVAHQLGSIGREISEAAEKATAAQRSTRVLAIVAAVFALLSFGTGAGLLFLQLHR